MIYNGVGYISSAMEEYDRAFGCYNRALTSFLKMEKIEVNCIMEQDYINAYDYLELSFRIRAELANAPRQSGKCGFKLSHDLGHEIDEVLRHASIYRENQEQR